MSRDWLDKSDVSVTVCIGVLILVVGLMIGLVRVAYGLAKRIEHPNDNAVQVEKYKAQQLELQVELKRLEEEFSGREVRREDSLGTGRSGRVVPGSLDQLDADAIRGHGKRGKF